MFDHTVPDEFSEHYFGWICLFCYAFALSVVVGFAYVVFHFIRKAW